MRMVEVNMVEVVDLSEPGAIEKLQELGYDLASGDIDKVISAMSATHVIVRGKDFRFCKAKDVEKLTQIKISDYANGIVEGVPIGVKLAADWIEITAKEDTYDGYIGPGARDFLCRVADTVRKNLLCQE